LRNPFEIETDGAESVPQMALQNEEGQEEVNVAQPSAGGMSAVGQVNGVHEIRSDAELQFEGRTEEFNGVGQGVDRREVSRSKAQHGQASQCGGQQTFSGEQGGQ